MTAANYGKPTQATMEQSHWANHMPGTNLNVLFILIHCIITATLQVLLSPSTAEETRAQKGMKLAQDHITRVTEIGTNHLSNWIQAHVCFPPAAKSIFRLHSRTHPPRPKPPWKGNRSVTWFPAALKRASFRAIQILHVGSRSSSSFLLFCCCYYY